VVPAYNSQKTISDCINALLDQNFPKNRYEIIIVDDGSTDKTPQIVKTFPVRLTLQKRAGPSAARNLGTKIAKGEIVAFTDSDCVPRPDWLSKLVNDFSNPSVAGVGGTYETKNTCSRLARIIGYEIACRHRSMPKFVDFLGSFNCAYRKEVLEKVGGFDTSYLAASGEDNDLSYRVHELGLGLVFNTNAVVGHYHPSNIWYFLKKQYERAVWRMKLYRKHPNKIGGDCYAGLSSFVQPLLQAFLFVAILLSPLGFWAVFVIMGVIILLLGLNLRVIIKMYAQSKDRVCFLALPVFLLRGFAWLLGLILGGLRSVLHK
jgi:cellulose synthase/poly-beta-1,6-N-acetylglucosamine synthase-like glycosyltransferase